MVAVNKIDKEAADPERVKNELRETLTDAAVLNDGAFGKLTGALAGENERAEEFVRLIGQYLYKSRRMRMVDATDLDDDHSVEND